MLITLTPNPSLDLLFTADRLVWDDANRVPPPRRRAGGQGVNVVRAARALDPTASARALALLGGAVGRELEEMLEAEGTPLTAIPSAGETRVFVGARQADGRSLLLNPRGAAVGAAEERAVLAAVDAALGDAEAAGDRAWLACCGSLPPGLPSGLYAALGRMARGRGHRFVPDCDGEALRVAESAGCDILVPNAHEAERLLNRSIRTPREAAAAARALVARGTDQVVVTLGADGAVAADGAGAVWAVARPDDALASEIAAGSAVGAGDAFLAAFLLSAGAGADMAKALANAVAAGTAALLGRGVDLVTAADAARVRETVAVSSLE